VNKGELSEGNERRYLWLVDSSDEFGELTLAELLEEGGWADSCLDGGLFAEIFV
jgi:hypothetical protein